MRRDHLAKMQEARKAARGHFVPWHCRRGHVINAQPDALQVICGKCSRDPNYRGTCEAKRADLYPHWAKKEAPTEADATPNGRTLKESEGQTSSEPRLAARAI